MVSGVWYGEDSANINFFAKAVETNLSDGTGVCVFMCLCVLPHILPRRRVSPLCGDDRSSLRSDVLLLCRLHA